MDDLNFRTRIKGDHFGAIPGCLGVILLDESSNEVVALTAGQVVRGAAAILADGQAIGTCSHDVDRRHDGQARRPTWSLLEMVRLDRDVSLARPSTVLGALPGPPVLRMTGDISTHLGQSVLVHGHGPIPREGNLRSTHALFRMPAPDNGEPTVFLDAMMITSLDGRPLSVEGDAGALVTSLHGDCLGVIVAGLDDSSYAAPIPPLLVDRPLQPIRDYDVEQWNETAWTRPLAPAPPAPVPPARRPVMALAIDMANDDWREDPQAMADAGRELARAAL